ncbi:MAG TPA: hypothetical protein VKY59_02775 [Spirillospora sp.]|nr:hypothetical protein [Spirillospora sp.]
MAFKKRADQVAGGVFLIGLAVLFMTGQWWPGILFVIGASSIARGVAEGHDWYSVPGGLWMIGLGLVFLLNFSWPMILILIGMSMLFGRSWHGRFRHENQDAPIKQKNEEKRKHEDAYILDETEFDEGETATIEDLLDENKDKRA